MINIITGSINCGKTSLMLSIYKSMNKGDGFILQKVFINDIAAGQQIIRLSSGAGIPFSFKDGYIPVNWKEAQRYREHSFSAEGQAFAVKIMEDCLEKGADPIFIDEIGPLELSGKGFAAILKKCLHSAAELYITVRASCLEAVIREFMIEGCRLIPLT